jgi:hypothetical protein
MKGGIGFGKGVWKWRVRKELGLAHKDGNVRWVGSLRGGENGIRGNEW